MCSCITMILPAYTFHKPRLSLARELHVHEGLRTNGFLSSCSPPSTFFECEKQGVLLFVFEGETLLPYLDSLYIFSKF